ncbi:dihydroxyacetone kinase family protein [Georgenia sp. Z1491]|uniref:dihydroxyacetone kinase family protein n=1 Tax=Georgenia sp. Z1491 TaxID=3416707 RepID=UPI003CEBAA15
MTKLVNNPDDFPRELVSGFVSANSRHVRAVPGGVARATRSTPGKVSVLVGGGTGHYPAFMGWVGPGMADGAVTGNIFSSPSASQAVSVAKAADHGGGTVICFGNYAGDVLHFGAAVEQLKAEGHQASVLVLTDDVASAGPDEKSRRRGISGFVPVFKITGAAAEAGLDFDGVCRVFDKANEATRTLGVAYSGCTLPGSKEPLFSVPEGRLSLGLGVHGEPGIDEMDMGTADEVARLLVTELLKERPEGADGRVVALLNGLGTAKYEELFVTYNGVRDALEEAGVTIVDQVVGELVTSLDMGGVSLTLVWLDDELEKFWLAPVDTPALKLGSMAQHEVLSEEERAVAEDEVAAIPESDDASRAAGAVAVDAISAIADRLRRESDELGRLDAVAGDGDHGIGMSRGATSALAAARAASEAGAGLSTVITRAGQAWSDDAGGTSGALWGAMILAAGGSLSDTGAPASDDAVAALRAASDALLRVGGAELGDKTMVDVVVPVVDAFEKAVADGANPGSAWSRAAVQARQLAEQTAPMRPRIGRARPLADRSVGTPDPGAVSAGIVVDVIAEALVS